MKQCPDARRGIVHDGHEWRDGNDCAYYCSGVKGVPTQRIRT